MTTPETPEKYTEVVHRNDPAEFGIVCHNAVGANTDCCLIVSGTIDTLRSAENTRRPYCHDTLIVPLEKQPESREKVKGPDDRLARIISPQTRHDFVGVESPAGNKNGFYICHLTAWCQRGTRSCSIFLSTSPQG
jgi:hypothetical protein